MEPVHNFRLFDRYFQLIVTGMKTVEVRPNWPGLITQLTPQALITFKSSGSSTRLQKRIVRVQVYRTVAELAAGEDLNKIDPELTAENVEERTRRLFNQEVVRELGLLVIEFE